MKLILLGAPGAGKGTQAKLIADKYGLLHIAAGDLLREAVAKKTELGIQAEEYMKRGALVPDQIVIDLIRQHLQTTAQGNGYILDGFPRTREQAEKLADVEDIDIVLNIDVNFDSLLGRLTGRRSCAACGEVYHIKFNPPKVENKCDKCASDLFQRPDDREEVIKKRLETYNEQTKPLIQFYDQKGTLKNIEGTGGIDGIFEIICSVLDGFGKN